jgi:hypothetical protein
MSEINDGGPAFPVQDAATWQGHGMSLRDYFAAKVLTPFLAGARLPPGFDATNEMLLMAQRAYEVADAMLKAREL